MGDATRTATTNAAVKEFRGIAWAALWFGALTIVITMLDYIGSIQPFSPTIAGWRYVSLASLTGFLGIPVMGAFAAALAAHYLERPVLAARLGVACKIIAIILVVAMILFLFDGLSMRSDAKPEERRVGDFGVVQTALKYVLYSLALFLLGRGLSAPRVAQGR